MRPFKTTFAQNCKKILGGNLCIKVSKAVKNNLEWTKFGALYARVVKTARQGPYIYDIQQMGEREGQEKNGQNSDGSGW